MSDSNNSILDPIIQISDLKPWIIQALNPII
jgi:hypothetical protein